MKQKISDIEFSHTDVKDDICVHLNQILQTLQAQGLLQNKTKTISLDRDGIRSLKTNEKLNFALISTLFDLPDFIELSQQYRSIICRRCWCDIEGQ